MLKKKASLVASFDDALKQLASDMIETMYEQNGVGLAGPQVGLTKRIFVALEMNKEDADTEDKTPPITVAEKKERWGVVKEHVIINPSITSSSGNALDIEGCLSIPGLYAEDVERFFEITMTYQDTDGTEHSIEAEGHFARILQHEFDHLEGTLFLDRLAKHERLEFMNEHRKDLATMQRDAKAFLKDIKNQVQPISIS